MKKTTLIVISALMIVSGFLTSCNKKLKEDIKELDSQVSDLKTKNDQLQGQIDGVNSILGSNEPITATTSFVDDDGVTRTWTDTYKFKSGNNSTQSMEANGDGTFDIYIERFSDVDWIEGAWLEFTYNPTSGAVTNAEGGHYWDWNLPYNDRTYFESDYTGCTVNITLSNINTTTGAISLSFSGTLDDAYGATYSTSYVPNDDKGATTTFSFAGTLKVYPNN